MLHTAGVLRIGGLTRAHAEPLLQLTPGAAKDCRGVTVERASPSAQAVRRAGSNRSYSGTTPPGLRGVVGRAPRQRLAPASLAVGSLQCHAVL